MIHEAEETAAFHTAAIFEHYTSAKPSALTRTAKRSEVVQMLHALARVQGATWDTAHEHGLYFADLPEYDEICTLVASASGKLFHGLYYDAANTCLRAVDLMADARHRLNG